MNFFGFNLGILQLLQNILVLVLTDNLNLIEI